MDELGEFMNAIAKSGSADGNLLGLLHLLIGQRIERDGVLVSGGLTWRESAALLKRVRWPRESASQLGVDLLTLAPRDRERFWYIVIARAGVDSRAARSAGAMLAASVEKLGYDIGSAPES